MDRAAAERFVAAWCASWCRVDIDAVVAHFADDAQMRSPLALSLTGSAVVRGAENIRAYWREAYGHIESADLKILSWSWDEVIARLTVWWQLGDTRASEFMPDGVRHAAIGVAVSRRCDLFVAVVQGRGEAGAMQRAALTFLETQEMRGWMTAALDGR